VKINGLECTACRRNNRTRCADCDPDYDPVSPSPVPPHLERLRAGANKWRDTVIRQAIEGDPASRAGLPLWPRGDPASFRYQRDQAHETIRELLALLDAEKGWADGAAALLSEAIELFDDHAITDEVYSRASKWLRERPS
jgi:hypothetical protein